MSDDNRVNFDHLANTGVLGYLSSPARIEGSSSIARQNPSSSPRSVASPYTRLGTHLDLVKRLWDDITVKLPLDCRWIVYGTPALVHPRSGIIFAFAEGNTTYTFRLPLEVRQKAISTGAKRVHQYPAYPELGIEASILDLAEIGEEWVLGGFFRGEEKWCLAAFNFADEPENKTKSNAA